MRSLDRDGRLEVGLRGAALAIITTFAVLLGRESTNEWWNELAQPLLDLGWVLLLGLPVVLPASATAGVLRRRHASGAAAWSAVLVIAQSVWVGWMAWFVAAAYDFRDARTAPFGVWLLCALWAGVALAIGALVEELIAGRPPQSR